MNDLTSSRAVCGACAEGTDAPPFSMAFQPIVDTRTQTVHAYEALVRGLTGGPAFEVLQRYNGEKRYAFDQACRIQAIRLASKLKMTEEGAKLSVNFMPGAIYSPAACIQKTLRVAQECGFPKHNLIFEITEDERVRDTAHLSAIVSEYQRHGFALALDDFGAGYSGLNLLAELRVDIIKLDAHLIRNIHLRPRSQQIVGAVCALAGPLGTRVIGEAVETIEEYRTLRASGIDLMQGYLFAKPAFEALPSITWP